MTAPPPPARGLYEQVIASIGTVFAVGNLVLSAVLLIGEPSRFTAASFVYIIDLASPPVWGAAFAVTGALALYGQVRQRRGPALYGHLGAAALCLFWVLAHLAGAATSVTASITHAVAYGILAATHAVLGVASPPPPRG